MTSTNEMIYKFNKEANNQSHFFFFQLTLVVAIVAFFFFCFGLREADRTYYKVGDIIAVENNIVILEDSEGEMWSFLGSGFEENTRVRIEFDNKRTRVRYDDEVVDVEVLYHL